MNQGVDPRRARIPEERDLGLRQVLRSEDPVPNRVVDVVVDIGHSIDDADDLPLECLRLLFSCVREDPVPHLPRQVERLGDPQRLLVVAETHPETLVERGVERVLPGVAKGRVPGVVAEPDRFGEILVQRQRPGHYTRDPGRLERVRHPGAVVVSGGVDEDLRLALQPAKGLGMEDAIAIALERRADRALLLGKEPASRLVRLHRESRERQLLVPAHALAERLCDSAGNLGHGASVVAPTAVGARRVEAMCSGTQQ